MLQRSFATILACLSLAVPLAKCAHGSQADYDQHVAKAQALDENGDSLAAFCEYIDAYTRSPKSLPAANALLDRLRTGTLPVHVPDEILSKLIGAGGPIEAKSFDGGAVISISPSSEIDPVNDPRSAWPFTRVTWFYRLSEKRQGERLCFAGIRCQTPDDLPLAERMGRLLCLLRKALVEKSGQLPLCDGLPINVWLCRHETDAGGEQWRNNIYFYEVATPRSSIEWIREIAHEYSHMAFPILGGDYTDPEPWANGYYGERLLLRWVARGAAGGAGALEKAWGQTFSGYANYERIKIAPPIALYRQNGLSSEWLDRRDAEGMNYVFGLLLTVDDRAGAKTCASLLWDLPQGGSVNPNLLLDGARAVLGAKQGQ
ncbi:MAG: hypothetical protein P4L33_12375 [Capsulimonadaceae bacterium]|nr:hypothetical protein [Capsulimonadaceae bacterium]